MSAPSGPLGFGRGGGRGRSRDGPRPRAGSEDRNPGRDRTRPTRGGRINHSHDRYAPGARLTNGNRPTARNGLPQEKPKPTTKSVIDHSTSPRNNLRGAAGRHGIGSFRPGHSTSVIAKIGRHAQPGQQTHWRYPGQVPYAEYKDRMHELWTTLKKHRERERKQAIRGGFLADPDKPTSLANAITPVGTCEDMCPEFERVERIVQQMVDAAEKSTGHEPLPDEDMMVKRFRRSAAGYDEQLPSDIRPPVVLKKTLDYLLRDVVGKNPLAQVHKFVWDRTRGIRNDFSIQQVTKREDVKVAINCFERIARFHILSLHLLSYPDQETGGFDQHQEREQLNNTLLSLMYYYDDNEGKILSYNEAEFRAYCVIFEIQDQRPDAYQRMASWDRRLLLDERVKLAMDLYAAADNILDRRGPMRPHVPFAMAHQNYSRFWTLLKGDDVPYLLACTAEIYFNLVRSMALEELRKAYRQPGNGRLDDWSLADLVPVLGFDDEAQVSSFCVDHGFDIGKRPGGAEYLNFRSVTGNGLTDMNPRRNQLGSWDLVESKRRGRTIPGVVEGLSVKACEKIGQIVEGYKSYTETKVLSGQSLFVSDDEDENSKQPSDTPNPFKGLGQAVDAPPRDALYNPFAAALKKLGSANGTVVKNSLNTSATASSSSTQGTSNPSKFTIPTPNPFQFGKLASNQSKISDSSSDPSQTSTDDMGRSTKSKPPTASPFMTSTLGRSLFKTSFGTPSGSFGTKPETSVFGQPSGISFGTPSIVPIQKSEPSVNGQYSEMSSSTHPSPTPARSDPANSSKPSILISEHQNSAATPDTSNKPSTESISLFGPDKTSTSNAEEGKSVFSNLQNPRKPMFTFDTSGAAPSSDAMAALEAYKDWKAPEIPACNFTSPPVGNTEEGTSAEAFSKASEIQPSSGPNHALPTAQLKGWDLGSRITKPLRSDVLSASDSSNLGACITQPGISYSGSRVEQSAAIENAPASNDPVKSTGSQSTPQSNLLSAGASPQSAALFQTQTSPVTAVDFTEPKPSRSAPTMNTTHHDSSNNIYTPSGPLGPPLTPLPQQLNGSKKGGVPFVSLEQARNNAAKTGLRERVLDTLAHELVCENDGLLNQYFQYSLDHIVIKAMDKVRRQEERQTVIIAREFLLAKKYARKWKGISYKRVLGRKGREKRKRFTDSMQELARNAKRRSDEAADIDSSPEKRTRVMPPPPKHADILFKSKSLPNQLGTKRSADDLEVTRQSKRIHLSSPNPITDSSKSHHKRSQTLGNSSIASGLTGPVRSHRLFFSPKSAKTVDTEHSIEAMREKARRLRIPLRSQDSTGTDYFLLKSYGLDPDTPLNAAARRKVPIDEGDLWASTSREKSLSPGDQVSIKSAPDGGSRKRRAPNEKAVSAPSPKRMSPPRVSTLHAQPATSFRPASTNPQSSNAVSASASAGDDDDEALFAQVRQVREAMTESVDWFRDELRRSSSETEKERRLREFRYTPSRSEIRLKATGARGLLPENWEFGRSIGAGSSIGNRRSIDRSFHHANSGKTVNFDSPTPAPRAMGFAALHNSHGGFGTAGSQYPTSSYGNVGIGLASGSGASPDDAIEL